MSSEKFFQENNVVMAFAPVDLQTGANNGDWVSLANYERCVCLLVKGAGTAGDDPIFKLQQSTNAAGSDAKDLTFTTIYKKVGTQTGIATFTRTTQSAATSYVDTASAEAEAIIGVEIKASDLDVDGGFKFVQLSVADVGTNAQLGAAIYLMLDARTQGETVPSAIA